MKTYTQAEFDAIRFDMSAANEQDNQGQLIIYTGMFSWADGSVRDEPEDMSGEDE